MMSATRRARTAQQIGVFFIESVRLGLSMLMTPMVPPPRDIIGTATSLRTSSKKPM